MRSRYLTALVIAIAMSLVFVSCDSFFTNNLFKSAGLGQVSVEDIQGSTSSQLVDQAYTDDGEPSTAFFEVLATDDTLRAGVLGTLETTYSDPTAPAADVQEAASLAAQIELSAAGADDLVNNLASNVNAFMSLETVQDAVTLVQNLVPDALKNDETSFAAAIDALLGSNDAYDALGGSILTNGGLAGNVNIGTAAQSALAAAALESVVVPAVTDPQTGASYTSTSAYLWDLMQGTQTQYPASFSLDTSTTSPLGNILAEAGFSIPSISF